MKRHQQTSLLDSQRERRGPSASVATDMESAATTKQQQQAEAGISGDEAANTRLFVQNLPAYVDSARLRAHFETQGEVTDACVIRTKDGNKSRRFGFVGYNTAKQAQHAIAFFDKTFFDTCRLSVRLAHTVSLRLGVLLDSVVCVSTP